MRTTWLALALILLPTASVGSAAENNAEIAAARRQLEMAQLQLRLYERDEYPRQLSQVERAIELAKAELESFKRRVIELEQFNDFKYSPPFFLSREEARLDVLRGELHLKTLEDDRFLLMQNRSDRARMLQLEVDAAAAQLHALLK